MMAYNENRDLDIETTSHADGQPEDQDDSLGAEWWGFLNGDARHQQDSDALCSLADAADRGEWPSLITMVKEFSRVHPNDWKPDDPSLDTLLHRVVRGGAPVDVVKVLLDYKAWRNIRNAQGERPVDIACRLQHAHLIELLEPRFVIDVPAQTLDALQQHFHALIKEVLPEDSEEDDFQLTQVMPDLSMLPERNNLEMVWVVDGMYGGFEYRLERNGESFCLKVVAWSRVGGMDDEYLVTPAGFDPSGKHHEHHGARVDGIGYVDHPDALPTIMLIHFGLTIDGAPDVAPIDRLGYARVGPQGMLALLEGELGLSCPLPSQGKRIIDYATALAACGGNRFYRASFDVDRLGVARQLLRWRDAWYLAGWNGHCDASAPARVRDMCDVERIAKHSLGSSIGERLSLVATRLASQRTQIENVRLIDRLEDFPVRWQQVLAWLPIQTCAHDQTAVSQAPTFPATDLSRAQAGIQALAAGQKSGRLDWENDGSLIVVADGPGTPLIAALAARTGPLMEQGSRVAIIASEDAAVLDDALSGAGLPRAGIKTHNLAHPALQLLPLALQILWQPADAAAILDFLNHPLTPLGRGVARALAEVVAGTPGTGGEAWNAALDHVLRNVGADYAERQRNAVRQWVQPTRYAPDAGIPVGVIRSRIDELAAIHRKILGKLGDGDDEHPADITNRSAALSHCVSMIELLGTTTTTCIKPRELVRLLDFASEQVATAREVAEVGHVALFTDPAALTDEVDTLIWWRCTAPRLPEPYPWSDAEIEALKKAGTELPSINSLLDQQARHWLRAVSRINRQLIVVLPPAEGETHPLVQMLSCLVHPLPVITAAEFAGQGGLIPLPFNPLPTPRRIWQLPDGVRIPRRVRYDGTPGAESHSSLALLLHAPHRWVLRYAAKITPGQLLALPETYTLYGLLLHKLAEWLFAEPDWLAWTDAELDTWFGRNFPALIEAQGLILLQPGRQAELATLRYRGHRAMSSLVRQLRLAGVVRVRTEVDVKGTFRGGPLSGSADLVVENSEGRTAIVDLKWSNYGDKYGTLLREGRHLQLAMYSHLLQQDGHAPTVAYFILNTARLLAQTRDYFPDADLASRPNPEQDIPHLWCCLENHWQWRRDQLDTGLIEVITEATEHLDDSIPAPDDGLPPEEPSDRYDDTLHLVGWGDRA